MEKISLLINAENVPLYFPMQKEVIFYLNAQVFRLISIGN